MCGTLRPPARQNIVPRTAALLLAGSVNPKDSFRPSGLAAPAETVLGPSLDPSDRSGQTCRHQTQPKSLLVHANNTLQNPGTAPGNILAQRDGSVSRHRVPGVNNQERTRPDPIRPTRAHHQSSTSAVEALRSGSEGSAPRVTPIARTPLGVSTNLVSGRPTRTTNVPISRGLPCRPHRQTTSPRLPWAMRNVLPRDASPTLPYPVVWARIFLWRPMRASQWERSGKGLRTVRPLAALMRRARGALRRLSTSGKEKNLGNFGAESHPVKLTRAVLVGSGVEGREGRPFGYASYRATLRGIVTPDYTQANLDRPGLLHLPSRAGEGTRVLWSIAPCSGARTLVGASGVPIGLTRAAGRAFRWPFSGVSRALQGHTLVSDDTSRGEVGVHTLPAMPPFLETSRLPRLRLPNPEHVSEHALASSQGKRGGESPAKRSIGERNGANLARRSGSSPLRRCRHFRSWQNRGPCHRSSIRGGVTLDPPLGLPCRVVLRNGPRCHQGRKCLTTV